MLTPNHFIIGETNANIRTGQFDNSQINHRKKWKNVQAATYVMESLEKGILTNIDTTQERFSTQ